MSGLDVAPVLFQQPPEVAEQATAVGNRATAEAFGDGQRARDPLSQDLLAEKPTDACRLSGFKQ